MKKYAISNDSSILITGGTGSFGRAIVSKLLKMHPEIKRLVIFSRDELKQYEMAKIFKPSDYPGLRYFLGDVRDEKRLNQALKDIDVVVHAAALKQVPLAEYNPFEFVKTNIIGAQNLIQASIDCGVKKVVALSTDKAASPINLYGASKLCSDKLFIAANNIVGDARITFSIVRYGNVMGSRGSVIPFFQSIRESEFLPITSKEMTRFNITLEQSVEMVLFVIENALGGEIFVPKIPSYRITDLASAIAPSAKIKIVGVRPGEKLHEEMITSSDSLNTLDIGDYFVIVPNYGSNLIEKYRQYFNGNQVSSEFSYNSKNNPKFLTVKELRTLINNIL